MALESYLNPEGGGKEGRGLPFTLRCALSPLSMSVPPDDDESLRITTCAPANQPFAPSLT